MRSTRYHSIVAVALIALLAEVSWAQGTADAEPPKMKMTTKIPPGITTPDDIETRLGDLKFFDGVPDEETTEKVYNFLDFQRGFQAYMSGIQIASMDALRRGILEFIYPLSQKDNPPKMKFVNVSDKFVNTIHRMDYKIFEEINEVVQAEPSEGESPEILGVLASIGIKKGQPFKPDARMKKILTTAAAAGSVSVKTIWSKPRDEMFYFYPGESNWLNPFPGGDYGWVNEGAKLLDARAGFHFYATGITPAMAKKII